MNYYLTGGLAKIFYTIEYGNLLFSTDGILKETPSNKAEFISTPLPINLKQSEYYRYLPFREYESEKISILELRNICVSKNGIASKNLRLVTESVYGLKQRRKKYLKSALYNFIFRKWEILPRSKKYTFAHNYYCPGYYHWLVEAIPRLVALGDKTKELVLLIPEYSNPDIYQSLEIFDFKEIKKINEKTCMMVNQLVLPSHPKYFDTYDPYLLQKVRKIYLEHVKNLSISLPEIESKIYISRKKARARKVSNEVQVVELLEDRGFVEICFEDYNFWEQVAIMSKAIHVISIYGAGLSNMMFMPPKGHILEFYRDFESEDEFHSKSYWRMAGALGLNYSYQLCLTEEIPKSIDTDDLVVEIPELEQNLKIMGL